MDARLSMTADPLVVVGAVAVVDAVATVAVGIALVTRWHSVARREHARVLS